MRGEESRAENRRARIKILVLIGALEVGGSERDIVRNFPLLNREEFEVVVAEFNHAGPLGRELTDRGTRVVSRPPSSRASGDSEGGRFAEAADRFATLLWVTALLRAERPDITHSVLPHSYVYQIIGGLLAGSRARRVMSRRSLNFYSDSQRLISWLERRFLHRRVDVAIGNSEPIVDELVEEGVDPKRVRLIRNGIDLSPFERDGVRRENARRELGVEASSFLMVAVGNLHTYKGHGDLMEACAKADGRLPRGWRLLIAGRDESGNLARFEALVARHGLGEHVAFLGPRNDIATLLLAADVFVHPSHHEGLPNAVIEAMAASLPVVATKVGGLPELVVPPDAGRDAETGWLVPPEDASALAEALIDAGGDSERRSAMGCRARERAQAEFSLARSVAQYESVYRGLLP